MQQQPQQSQTPDIGTIAYRMATIEQSVQHLQTELQRYVPARENEIQLQSIRSTVERIEGEVKEARKEITSLNTQVTAQRQESDNMQIRVLKWIVVTIIGALLTIAVGVLLFYITRPGG